MFNRISQNFCFLVKRMCQIFNLKLFFFLCLYYPFHLGALGNCLIRLRVGPALPIYDVDDRDASFLIPTMGFLPCMHAWANSKLWSSKPKPPHLYHNMISSYIILLLLLISCHLDLMVAVLRQIKLHFTVSGHHPLRLGEGYRRTTCLFQGWLDPSLLYPSILLIHEWPIYYMLIPHTHSDFVFMHPNFSHNRTEDTYRLSFNVPP